MSTAVAAGHPDPSTLPVSHVVSGKYAIVRRIAMGGMGTVYEAENLAIGRRVALKVLAPRFARLPEALARFQREARAAARIGHPNIIDVLDMGVSEAGLPYIVMELLHGYDLARSIGAAPMAQGPSVDVALQICAALGAAHDAGIVHRDLKPENVFFARRGPFWVVKVIDFGIARFLDGEAKDTGRRITSKGVVLGTAAYMSPEQARGDGGLDHRSDIYSVGVILYEMLSGRAPYRGATNADVLRSIVAGDPPSLAVVAPWVKEGLAFAVGRAMARNPAARFQSAAALAAALGPFASSRPSSTERAPSTPASSGPDASEAASGREPDQCDRISWLPGRGSPRRRWLALLAIWIGMWLAGFLVWQNL